MTGSTDGNHHDIEAQVEEPQAPGHKQAPTTNTAAENLGTDEKQAPQTKPEDHVDSHQPHQDNSLVPADPHDMDEYDERATKLWSVYMEEAESHDKALFETWKDDMEGIIIFAGLYSASLTAFLQQSFPNLTPNYVQQNAYYSQQAVVLLARISAQLEASGSPVPPTVVVPPAFPDFRPAPSDVRVNVYWFMSLIFSLTAALAATIVQQWVQPPPQTRPQFLYEGAENWYMPVVVDVVPALIHVSLFLIFMGLADYLFQINVATATTTTIMIVICAGLYLWTVIAPVHDAQSPYQSPLSGIFWYLYQVIRGRTHRDHSTGGARKRGSTNMTEGRVQLAMDESDDRKKRDARAIQWVAGNLTEDSELEPFVLGIPGSFNSKWGKKVWDTVVEDEGNRGAPVAATAVPRPGEVLELRVDVPQSPGGHLLFSPVLPSPALVHRENTIRDLSGRITRLLKTCTDPGILPTEEARRKRARACVDASLSFVLSVDNEWEWFAEPEIMSQALTYLGGVERIREPSTSGFDPYFTVRWTCMSMIAARKMLNTSVVHNAARRVVICLAEVCGDDSGNEDEMAARTTGIIDRYLQTGWASGNALHASLKREVEADKMEESFLDIMTSHQLDIRDLGEAWNSLGWAENADEAIIDPAPTMIHTTGGVLSYIPSVVLAWPQDSRRAPDKGMRAAPPHLIPQFIPPRFLTQRLWLCVCALRNISAADWGASPYHPQALGDLSAPEMDVPEIRRAFDMTPTPMKVQLWRVQDLREGGFVFMLELFVSAVLASKVSLHHSSRPLFVGTFRSLTSDWKEHQDRQATQRLLVRLLQRVLQTNPDSSSDEVPAYIVDEFLTFIGGVLAEKKGSHVAEAISLIEGYRDITLRGGTYAVAENALQTISPPKPPKPPKIHHSSAQTDSS